MQGMESSFNYYIHPSFIGSTYELLRLIAFPAISYHGINSTRSFNMSHSGPASLFREHWKQFRGNQMHLITGRILGLDIL